MSYVIIAIVVLSMTHFLYESAIAPSWRLSIRYRLFALRDRLRTLKIEHADQLDDKHFHYLQDSINSTIRVLPRIEFMLMVRVMAAIEKDKHLKERLEARLKILDDCTIPEIAEIRGKSIKLSTEALAANGGMLALYATPFMIFGGVCKSLNRKTKTFISIPAPDMQKVAPAVYTNSIYAN